MFEWIKSWFFEEESPKPTNSASRVEVSFSLPNGKPLTLEHFYNGCKKHPEYSGRGIPKNNCNDCWEFCSRVTNHKN